MKGMLTPLLCAVSLALGYWLGATGRARGTPPNVGARPVEEHGVSVSTAAGHVANAASETRPPAPKSSAAESKSQWLTPFAVFQEYKRQNLGLKMPALGPDGKINAPAAMILGLSEVERTKLDHTIAAANEAIEVQRAAVAKVETSADGKTMTIVMPSIAAEGTPIYRSLVAQMRDALGEERYSLFSDIFGEYFDAAFDHFGADDVRYQVNLDGGIQADGKKVYSYLRTSAEPDPRHLGTVYEHRGTVSPTDVNDTLLRRFLFPKREESGSRSD